MVAYLRSRSQRFPVALIAGLAVAALIAAIVLALPATALGQMVETLALGGMLPAGEATRVALALGAGAALGAIAWSILVLTIGTHVVLHAWRSDTPVLRPSDAHPDAPARSPIRASEELGPPLEMEAPFPAEQPVPADLDQPLAAYDPGAIPAAPREPVRPVAPLVRAERIETFELTPLVRNAPEPQPSLANLLDRLERGAAHNPRRTARSLQAALGALRDSPA